MTNKISKGPHLKLCTNIGKAELVFYPVIILTPLEMEHIIETVYGKEGNFEKCQITGDLADGETRYFDWIDEIEYGYGTEQADLEKLLEKNKKKILKIDIDVWLRIFLINMVVEKKVLPNCNLMIRNEQGIEFEYIFRKEK